MLILAKKCRRLKRSQDFITHLYKHGTYKEIEAVAAINRSRKCPRSIHYKNAKRGKGYTKKQLALKEDIVTTAGFKFAVANSPDYTDDLNIGQDDVHCGIDPNIDRCLQVIVRYGGGGKANPVPFLANCIHHYGLGDFEEHFVKSKRFTRVDFQKLTCEVMRDKIAPRLKDLFKETTHLPAQQQEKFLIDCLLRRLNDLAREPRFQNQWDSHADSSTVTDYGAINKLFEYEYMGHSQFEGSSAFNAIDPTETDLIWNKVLEANGKLALPIKKIECVCPDDSDAMSAISEAEFRDMDGIIGAPSTSVVI